MYFSESSGRRQGLYHSQEMGNTDLEPYFDLSGEISTQSKYISNIYVILQWMVFMKYVNLSMSEHTATYLTHIYMWFEIALIEFSLPLKFNLLRGSQCEECLGCFAINVVFEYMNWYDIQPSQGFAVWGMSQPLRGRQPPWVVQWGTWEIGGWASASNICVGNFLIFQKFCIEYYFISWGTWEIGKSVKKKYGC